MNDKLKRGLIRYGITTLVGAGMAALVLKLHGYAELETELDRYRMLSDAFTIPGTILLMLGLLVWISSTGVFNGIGYALRWMRMTLTPFDRDKHEKYADYVLRKRKQPKAQGGFLVITGAAFLAVAILFLILFYRILQ